MNTGVIFARAFAFAAIAVGVASCGGGGSSGSVPAAARTPVPNPGTEVQWTSIAISNPPQPNGVPTSFPITVTAYTAAESPITGTYAQPITLSVTASEGVTLETTSVKSSSEKVLAEYDGHTLANPAISTNVMDISDTGLDSSVQFRPSLGGTEYEIPSGNTTATTMALASDGSIWFPEANAVGRVTTSGSITEFPANNNGYGYVATGPDRNAWLISSGPSGDSTPAQPGGPPVVFQYIARLTTSGLSPLYPTTTTVYGPYLNLVAAPNGNFYFAIPGAVQTATVSGSIAQAFPLTWGGGPENGVIGGIATSTQLFFLDYLGNLFTCSYAGSCTTTELPPLFPGATSSIAPNGFIQGFSGDLISYGVQAVSDQTTSGTVKWTTYLLSQPFITSGQAAFADGYVWLAQQTDSVNGAVIDRFASDGSYVAFEGPADAQAYSIGALVLGSDGRLWYSRGSYIGAITLSSGVTAEARARAEHRLTKY